jgi:hypothetical protein
VRRYRARAKWWPDRAFEALHIRNQQEARFEADAWQDDIAEYLRAHTRVTVGQVAHEALHIEKARLGTADQRRITTILERLGWHKGGAGTAPV